MVNLVVLLGNLCFTPDLKYTKTGAAVTDLRLAVSSTYRTTSGEKKESTLFIDVVVWGRSAEACAEHLDKGSKVFVQGELRRQEWDDKQTGQKRSKIEVYAKSVQFITTKKSNGARETVGAPASTPTEASEPEEDVPF